MHIITYVAWFNIPYALFAIELTHNLKRNIDIHYHTITTSNLTSFEERGSCVNITGWNNMGTLMPEKNVAT